MTGILLAAGGLVGIGTYLVAAAVKDPFWAWMLGFVAGVIALALGIAA